MLSCHSQVPLWACNSEQRVSIQIASTRTHARMHACNARTHSHTRKQARTHAHADIHIIIFYHVRHQRRFGAYLLYLKELRGAFLAQCPAEPEWTLTLALCPPVKTTRARTKVRKDERGSWLSSGDVFNFLLLFFLRFISLFYMIAYSLIYQFHICPLRHTHRFRHGAQAQKSFAPWLHTPLLKKHNIVF